MIFNNLINSQNVQNSEKQTVVKTTYRTDKVILTNDLNGVLPLEFIDECKNSKVYMMNLVSDLKNTEIKKGTSL